jgi:NAD(P)-dependent dehydrogenase (short-subunit alcohol dehydrogenase family)
VKTISEALDNRGLEPDAVVNNAGFGLLGGVDKFDRAEQLAMIDLNVRSARASPATSFRGFARAPLSGWRGWLSRPQEGPPRGRSGFHQQDGGDVSPLCAARLVAPSCRPPTEMAPPIISRLTEQGIRQLLVSLNSAASYLECDRP